MSIAGTRALAVTTAIMAAVAKVNQESKMKSRHKTTHPHGGSVAGAAEFHSERIRQETRVEAKNEVANRPQGDYEYEQMIAENSVFNPKQLIEEAAYFFAEKRGFAPGHEVSDWLQAEQVVEGMLLRTK